MAEALELTIQVLRKKVVSVVVEEEEVVIEVDSEEEEVAEVEVEEVAEVAQEVEDQQLLNLQEPKFLFERVDYLSTEDNYLWLSVNGIISFVLFLLIIIYVYGRRLFI